MRFEHTITYPAPLETVAAMLTDVEYTKGRFAAARVNAKVEAAPANPSSIIARIPLDASLLPEPANRFVPADTVITLTETWGPLSGSTLSGTAEGDFPGLPIRMTSQSQCVGENGVTQRTITGELTVSIPFMGGRIEQMIDRHLGSLVRQEEEFAAHWLTSSE